MHESSLQYKVININYVFKNCPSLAIALTLNAGYNGLRIGSKEDNVPRIFISTEKSCFALSCNIPTTLVYISVYHASNLD